MNDVLKKIKKISDRLFAHYGDPLAYYNKTPGDVDMTYYADKLMEVRGHERIILDGKDSAYYSEKALHEAFLAGKQIGSVNREVMREQITEDVKAEIRETLELLGKDKREYYC